MIQIQVTELLLPTILTTMFISERLLMQDIYYKQTENLCVTGTRRKRNACSHNLIVIRTQGVSFMLSLSTMVVLVCPGG